MIVKINQNLWGWDPDIRTLEKLSGLVLMYSQGEEPLALEKEPEGLGQDTGFELQLQVTSLVASEKLTNLPIPFPHPQNKMKTSTS